MAISTIVTAWCMSIIAFMPSIAMMCVVVVTIMFVVMFGRVIMVVRDVTAAIMADYIAMIIVMIVVTNREPDTNTDTKITGSGMVD